MSVALMLNHFTLKPGELADFEDQILIGKSISTDRNQNSAKKDNKL